MNVFIIGAGFTGVQLAKILSNERNNVTLIDNNEEITRHLVDQIDCTILTKDGNNLENLESVGISKADVLICLTESDEVNMITCSLVDSVYPKILKIARVRNYAYYLNSASAKKTHAETFSGNHRPLYGIDFMIHPDVEAAEAIVQAVENGAVSNIIAFENSEMQISRIKITEKSILCRHKLMELKSLTDINMLVSYVESNGETKLAGGNTLINKGDTLGILSKKQDVPKIIELLGSRQQEFKKIAIVGAGRIGSLITEKLIQPKKLSILKRLSEKKTIPQVQITIIDSDYSLAKAASEKFGKNVHIFNADATDINFLKEEKITDFDLVICTTHNHEMNMIVAAYLESLGVKQSISLVKDSAFSSIAEKLGIDVSVALRDVIVDSIMSHMRGTSVKEIHTISNSDFEIIECIVPKSSKIIGKSMKEIAKPGRFFVLLDRPLQKDDFEIVTGDTIFNSDDHLVLIARSEEVTSVLQIFESSEG